MTPSNLARWSAKLAAVLILWLAARLGLHIADADATVLAAGLITLGAAAVPSLRALIHRGPLSDYVLGHQAGAKAGRKGAFDEAARLVASVRLQHAKAAYVGEKRSSADPLADWTQTQLGNAVVHLQQLGNAK